MKKNCGPKIDEKHAEINHPRAHTTSDTSKKNTKKLETTYLVCGNENFCTGTFEFTGELVAFSQPTK